MAPIDVLVVGAGIAGNAVAFWLSRLGHSVTVVERHSELRVNGLQLDLRGDGIEVVKRMGLEHQIRAKCVPEEGVELVDSRGRSRAFFAANKSGKGAQSMSSEFEIMRGDLCHILHTAAVENGAKYLFGASLTGFVEKGGKVEVTLVDGKMKSYHLIVGCDGQGSMVRRLVLDEDSAGADAMDSKLTTLDERIAYFTIPRPIQESEKYIATAYMMPEKRFLLMRRHNKEQMQVYLKADTTSGSGQLKNVKRKDVNAQKEAFAKLFQNGGWRTNEVVEELRNGAEDFYCQYSGFVKMDRWSTGRVTLVGDAGYGCPPDGFGTSAALLGAYVLAGEIGSHCPSTIEQPVTTTQNGSRNENDDGVLLALQAYENTFQPYMKELQKGYSAEPNFFDKIPWTPFTVGLFNRAMGIASFLKLDKIATRFMPAENAKGWKMPGYQHMVEG